MQDNLRTTIGKPWENLSKPHFVNGVIQTHHLSRAQLCLQAVAVAPLSARTLSRLLAALGTGEQLSSQMATMVKYVRYGYKPYKKPLLSMIP